MGSVWKAMIHFREHHTDKIEEEGQCIFCNDILCINSYVNQIYSPQNVSLSRKNVIGNKQHCVRSTDIRQTQSTEFPSREVRVIPLHQ